MVPKIGVRVTLLEKLKLYRKMEEAELEITSEDSSTFSENLSEISVMTIFFIIKFYAK